MKKIRFGNCIAVITALLFLLPYMGVIFYTLPRNDEFACAYGIVNQGGYSLLTLCRRVANDYMVWEGNYSGIFIYSMLNPIVIGNSDSTVYFMNIICFIGFVIGWTYIIYRCLSFFDIDKKYKNYLSLAGLILSMNCRFMRETLGWYTGYMYYTLQLLLGCLGLFMVYDLISKKADSRNKKKEVAIMVAACLFEVIGAGGTLHVSAILCWIILLLLIWAVYRKKEWIKAAILFASIFISTIVNVAAPGHRVRKDGYASVSLVKGVAYTVVCVYKEIRRICTQTYLPYVFLIMFILMIFIIREGRNIIELNPFMTAFAGIACILGSTFPVCYGYGRAYMASRGMEMLDLMIVIWSMIFLLSVANTFAIKKIRPSADSVMTVAIMGIFLFCTVAIGNIEVSDIPTVQCISGLANGSIKDYSDYWRNVLHQVENSDDRDLVIDVDSEYLDRECIIDRVMIQEDPTDWVNTSMATVYGHDTVRIRRK